MQRTVHAKKAESMQKAVHAEKAENMQRTVRAEKAENMQKAGHAENTQEKDKAMTWQETLDYIETLGGYGIVPGLANMENLCEKLGHPEQSLRFVHIAGTNGKGSVLAFLSEILKEAGYKVGRYFSPAIFEYREQIQINGRSISKKDLAGQMTELKKICDRLVAEGKPHPTAFEVETALAFRYFAEKKCDIVVLECGMGGLLDATNVISNTLVSVFTSISYDHMAFFGKTLREIASVKAGIMKAGSVAVALKGEEETEAVLKEKAAELSIPLIFADPSAASIVKSLPEKQTFSYGKYQKLEIALAGRYQIANAVLALEVVQALQNAGIGISEKALRQGLFKTVWPGRFQIIVRKPYFIADGAHNRDGAAKLAESVRFYFTNKRIIYIMGMLRDKEQEEVLKETAPYAEQILTVPTKGGRGLSSYDLACMAREYHHSVTALDSVQEAVEMAYLMADKETVIIAFGSLSYLGEVITLAEKISSAKSMDKIVKKVGKDSHGK